MAHFYRRGSKVSKLTVAKATEIDVGSYKCRASNAVGYVDTKPVDITLDSEVLSLLAKPSSQ